MYSSSSAWEGCQPSIQPSPGALRVGWIPYSVQIKAICCCDKSLGSELACRMAGSLLYERIRYKGCGYSALKPLDAEFRHCGLEQGETHPSAGTHIPAVCPMEPGGGAGCCSSSSMDSSRRAVSTWEVRQVGAGRTALQFVLAGGSAGDVFPIVEPLGKTCCY